MTVSVIDPNQKINNSFAQISESDFRIEWFSGTGKGGQHRNKHMNSCRMIHIPTGLKQERTGRVRSSNEKEAKQALLALLNQKDTSIQSVNISKQKSEQKGSGMRGDKIRTIRFQDDIAKDHRTGKSISASQYMKGMMDLLW